MSHSFGDKPEVAAAAPKLWGVMAEFDNPAHLSVAAEKVRDAGYKVWDVYSPVPVHGMDECMGLKPSKVTFIMGLMALTGFSCALLMQWWMGAVDYKIVTAGKPLFAWEQATPITFELSVLFSAFGAVFGMLALNLLPMWHHPLMTKERFLRVSDDRFVIAIEAKDPQFDQGKVMRMFETLGGKHVDVVED
jgi:hypothetical protein